MKTKFNKPIVISIIIGLVAILAIIGIIIATNNNENNKESNKKIVHDTDGTILYEFEDEKLIEIADYMNTFDYVTFKKIITETTLAEDGTVKNMEHIQCIVADVNTMDNIDITVDILSTPEGGDPIIDGDRPDFKETFGFDHTQYDNVFDVVMKMAKMQGIGTDLENTTYNEYLYEIAQQETYVFNNEELPIIKEILSAIEFDEIVNAGCQYTITESDAKDGFYINHITATVKYKINGETKIRNIVYAVGVHYDPIEDPLK